MSDQATTRLADPYRAALQTLRRDIMLMTNEPVTAVLLDRVQDVADELMRGTAPLVQVPLSEALELPSDADVSGLLSDQEPTFSAARDNRQSERGEV